MQLISSREVMWVTEMTRHLMFNIKYFQDLLPSPDLDCSLILKNKTRASATWTAHSADVEKT